MKLKYLPVPHGSIVVMRGLDDDVTEEWIQELVEDLIVASGHDDFLVLQMDNDDAQIEIVERAEIEKWLDARTVNPNVMPKNLMPEAADGS